MAETKTFKIKVRLYEDGENFAVTHHDVENYGVEIDPGDADGLLYREFDLEVTAALPVKSEQTVAISVPDDPAPLADASVTATAA